MRRAVVFAAALALLSPRESFAWPVAKVLDAQVGKEQFFRAWIKAAGTDRPEVATAELLPSQEILLTPVAPGRALVFLVGETSLDAVRLRVAAEGEGPAPARATDEQRAAARKACPGFKEEGSGAERKVSVAVSSAACRTALRELFKADDYSTRRLALTFDPATLRDQLQEMQAALKARGLGAIKIGYSGVTLKLEGRATPAQKLEAMKSLFEAAVGPILFEDAIELIEEAKR